VLFVNKKVKSSALEIDDSLPSREWSEANEAELDKALTKAVLENKHLTSEIL
jgi:hypothetical protein